MLNNTRGVVYVLTLAIMLLLFSMSMTYFFTLRAQSTMNQKHLDGLKAFYFAEAGIEHGISELRATTNYDGDGGIGSISPKDLDGNAGIDYSATYLPSSGLSMTGTLTATGTVNLSERTIIARVSNSPWRGALQSGAMIDASSAVNGNLDGDIASFGPVMLNPPLDHSGFDVMANDASVVIPTPNMGNYFTLAGTVTPCGMLMVPTPPPAIYYINGSCTIDRAGGPFDLNGSIIVAGVGSILTLQNIGALNITGTISGADTIPALLSENDIQMLNINNATIDGLIYAQENMIINNFTVGFDVDDGAIVAGNNLNMTGVNNLNVQFDDELDPPYFSWPAVNHRILSWKGHRY